MPNQAKKILFVSTLDDPKDGAGAERTLNLLMATLKGRGHDVAIASTSSTPGIHRHERGGIRIWRAGIKNIFWPQRETKTAAWPMRRAWHLIDAYNWAMRRQLSKIIAIEKPDVISAHQLAGWSVSAFDAAAEAKVPLVHVLHDYYNACPNSMLFRSGKDCELQCGSCHMLRRHTKAISNKATAVVGVSQYVLDRHLALGYYTHGPSRHVIHNARSRTTLKLQEAEVMRQTRALIGSGIRFGYIGTLAPHKGLDLLIEAFLTLPQSDSTLVIAGSGKPEYVAALKARFESQKIRFLGQVEPYQFFAQVDVSVVPSLWQENLPGVVIESLAFGVPVIGSRRGGIPELIAAGTDGLIFEPDELGSLAAAMDFFLTNPGKLNDFREAARRHGDIFLNPESWGKTYETLYQHMAMRDMLVGL